MVVSSSSAKHGGNEHSAVIPGAGVSTTPDEQFLERVRAASGVVQPLTFCSISAYDGFFEKTHYRVVRGGILSTAMRRPAGLVGEYVRKADAAAGINGTFFGPTFSIVGPAWSSQGALHPEFPSFETQGKVIGRPLVVWNDDTIAFVPYLPKQLGLTDERSWGAASFTNGFVAGEWLVHGGKPMVRPANIPVPLYGQSSRRPRSFLGITPDGVPFIAATINKVDVATAAKVAQSYGACEAVLLDSGYSTALVYRDQEIVKGDHPPKRPRPVPHVILVNEPSLAGLLAADVTLPTALSVLETPCPEPWHASLTPLIPACSQEPNCRESCFPGSAYSEPLGLGDLRPEAFRQEDGSPLYREALFPMPIKA